MVPSMVTKDVFVVVESFVKNQCKGKPYNFILFNLFALIFFFQFLICFFHLHVGNKSMVLRVLIGVGEALVQKLEIQFLAHNVMDAFGIVYYKY
jgi:hypothetical protein